jgi:hypothetical protein
MLPKKTPTQNRQKNTMDRNVDCNPLSILFASFYIGILLPLICVKIQLWTNMFSGNSREASLLGFTQDTAALALPGYSVILSGFLVCLLP